MTNPNRNPKNSGTSSTGPADKGSQGEEGCGCGSTPSRDMDKDRRTGSQNKADVDSNPDFLETDGEGSPDSETRPSERAH